MQSESILQESAALETAKAKDDWGYGQLFSILLRRKFWFVGTFLSVLIISGLLTLISKPVYRSSMRVLVEPNYKSRPQPNGNLPQNESFIDQQVQVDITTQLEVLESSELLEKAIAQLIQDYPSLTLEDLRENLTISPITGTSGSQKVQTNILRIEYNDDSPLKTQRILKTLLSVYQAYNLEQQKLRLARGLAFINEQLPGIKRSVLEAEAALTQFRKGNNIIDPGEQAKAATVTLDTLGQQREALKSQIQEAVARLSTLQRQLSSTPEGALTASRLSESTIYQNRLLTIQRTDIELEQQRQLLTDEHPIVQELAKRRQQQEDALKQDAANVLGVEGRISAKDSELISKGQVGENELSLLKDLAVTESQLNSLRAKEASLSSSNAQLEQDLRRFPNLISQYERLQPEVQLRRSTLQKLLDARQDLSLEISRGGYAWEVIDPPLIGDQISPVILRNLALGMVIGLFLGAIAAFIRESLDDRVHTQTELEEQLPMPLLGVVPYLQASSLNNGPMAVNSERLPTMPLDASELLQWQPLRESLDFIYTNIQLLQSTSPLKSIVITSAQGGEGKSTLSLGLAISAARLDQRVLLIDADLRNPTLHKLLSLSNGQGLSTILTGEVIEQDLLALPQWVYMRWNDSVGDVRVGASQQSRAIPPSDLSIDILTSGPDVLDPVKLLNPMKLKEFIKTYENSYDLILIDSPPVLGMVDALQLGTSSDGVILVARIDKVKRNDLKEASEMLGKMNRIGVIANGATATNRSYYGYSRV
jgi:polysaccharide biosynthesis transport protein